jgi:hypothetical protein
MPTRSILYCIRDGKFDLERFLQYRSSCSRRRTRIRLRKRLFRRHDDMSEVADIYYNEYDGGIPKAIGPKTRRPRCVWGRLNDDGVKVAMTPEESMWYTMYVNNPLIATDQSMHDKFRQRFRLPYNNYIELVDMCRADYRFDRWCGFKKNKKKSSPIELLVLGSLRYLGRGFTFDDIEECTAISTEVHRTFFHLFVDFGRNVLYPKFVRFPKTTREATTHMAEFVASGFPGCVGSSDCTHISTERCEYALRNQHIGQKSSSPTRSFSLTANHRRQILHTSSGGPGSWNDQTMVRHDEFVSGIYEGQYLNDIEFKMHEYDSNRRVVKRKYKGAYVIVDNGYLRWSVTVPPFKVTNRIDEIRWSKWVESMRKDVECTFGILKGRFRILKAGVRLDGINAVDNVWFTCCALHNWLLEIDGLTGEWRDGVPVSDWEGTLGQHDDDYPLNAVPNAVTRLHSNLNFRNFDSSGMGPGADIMHTINYQEVLDDLDEYSAEIDGMDEQMNIDESTPVRTVRHLPLKYFRRKLVEHFDILFHHNQIKWTIR